ncbi:MAG TPA: hypothetical protein VND93_24390 [Myxococcales bacterium]|nr:hypothetical protein [Myxococcales bacterium]
MLLVMTILAAAAAASIVMASRLSIDIAGRRPDAARLQALWLARSAILSGLSGSQQVLTHSGEATVHTERREGQVKAVVVLEGGKAEVSAVPGAGGYQRWEERYDPPPAPGAER